MTPAFSTQIHCSFEEALQRTVEALRREDFGVLTEIDVQGTMKQKLGVAIPPYRILGACNPPLAWRALQAEDRVGLLLPCNVVVRATPTGVEVSAVDPEALMATVDNPGLAAVAAEASAKLRAAVASLGGSD
ncbi:MAG TPA: DUF302 domain-containing protein [Caulobacteraceae bacterium]|jgi:uncharacterized protein (DUF302 family)|nr:DUF302 domain-containing protein [Caulobacteraceae bacterium]